MGTCELNGPFRDWNLMLEMELILGKLLSGPCDCRNQFHVPV